MGTAAGGRTVSEGDGIIPRACADLFKSIEEKCDNNAQGELSYMEVYNEEIRDLLTDDTTTPLRIRETMDGQVYVRGLQSRPVKSPEQIGEFMEEASKRRVVAATKMNATSSRSHAICVLRVKGVLEDDTKFEAKLTLVDLAGSERIKKTGAEGGRAQEGININKGLFVLGQVVSALAEQRPKLKRKPPYRDSKLTRLLQDSLGGNSRTIMIACASPADFNVEESINTLRYATSARNIQNTATRNVVKSISPEEAAKLRRENALLKEQVKELTERIAKLTARESFSEDDDTDTAEGDRPSIIEEGDEENSDDGAASPVPAAAQPAAEDVPTSPMMKIRKSIGSLGGFLEMNRIEHAASEAAHAATRSDDISMASTVKTVPELEKEISHLGKALRKAKRDMRKSMRETAVDLPMMRVRVAALEDELKESHAVFDIAEELQEELTQAKAEADSAKKAASKLSEMLDHQIMSASQSNGLHYNHEEPSGSGDGGELAVVTPKSEQVKIYVGSDYLKLEEAWVTFAGSVLISFKEQLRLLGDFFDLVVRVVESPDILSMIPTKAPVKKAGGWFGRGGGDGGAAEAEKAKEEAALRTKLLQEHMHFFNDRFCEVEEEFSFRSENLENLKDKLSLEWKALSKEVDSSIRGTLTERDEDLLAAITDTLLGPLK